MSQQSNGAIAVIGIDIGKNSFHVVAHDQRGAIVLRQKWSRGQISAPKGTPSEIVDILNKAVGEALKDPKLVARLAEVGGIPKPMTPAEFGRLVADETEKWRKVVEFAGVSVD